MPRLPVDILDIGQREVLPSAMPEQRMASPDDFGAQSGRALQQLGSSITQFGGVLKANKQRLDAFNTDDARIKTENNIQLQYSVDQRALKGDGEGFWAGQRDNASKQYDTLIENAKDPALKSQLTAKKDEFLGRFTLQAFQAQYQQQDKHTGDTLDEDARTSGRQVQQNPDIAPQLIKQHGDLIDASTLPDEVKKQRKTIDAANMAYTAEIARAKNDPQAVLAGKDGSGYKGDGGYVDALIKVESGGRVSAAADTSSAVGLGQFTKSTWENFLQAKHPDLAGPGGLALRTDEPLMREAIGWLTDTNAKALTGAGQQANNGNLYLAHFLGAGGAVSVLKASPGTPLSSVLDAQTLAANRFLIGKDVDWVQHWAANKMGSSKAYVPGSQPTVTGNYVADNGVSKFLTPQQNAQVQETAQSTYDQQQQTLVTAQKQAHSNDLNKLYIGLSEGDAPTTTYQNAVSGGMLDDYSERAQAQTIIAARVKKEGNLSLSNSLVDPSSGVVANGFDKEHRDAVSARYDSMVKSGQSPEDAGAWLFERTGILPEKMILALKGGNASTDPKRVEASLITANNILKNPNAFAGQEGTSGLESDVAQYRKLTNDLGYSSEQAAQQIVANRQEDQRNPLKKEQIVAFKNTSLTQAVVESRVSGLFSSHLGAAGALPVGGQRSNIDSIYGEMAEEGYRKFSDPAKAMDYADLEFKKQFGVQNGIITRYPPANANLPKLPRGVDAMAIPGMHDPYGWINEQAAQMVKEHTGQDVSPDQIVLVPVERGSVSTRAAFNGSPVYGDRGGTRDRQPDTFRTVPYQIAVIPKDVTQEPIPMNGVFFPDVESFVKSHNVAQKADQKVETVGKGARWSYPRPDVKSPDDTVKELEAQSEKIKTAAQADAAKNLDAFVNLPESDPLIVEARKRQRAGDDDPKITRLLAARDRWNKQ